MSLKQTLFSSQTLASVDGIEHHANRSLLSQPRLDLGSGLNVETSKYPIRLTIPSHRMLLSIHPPAIEATMRFLEHTPVTASNICQNELDGGICWPGVAT